MSALTLYQLTDQYRELQRLADTDEIDSQALADTLEGLTGEIQVKATNVAKFAANLEATAAAIDEASKKMAARGKALQARADHLRAYLKTQMEAAGISRIECPELVLAIRQNPPAVVVTDEASIPGDYWIEPPPPAKKLDKKMILEVLKHDGEVPGCHLERATRLEIK